MAEIEDQGMEEFYADFIRVDGKRGEVLLFSGGLPHDAAKPASLVAPIRGRGHMTDPAHG